MIAKQQQQSKGELRALKKKLAALPDDRAHAQERSLILTKILTLLGFKRRE